MTSTALPSSLPAEKSRRWRWIRLIVGAAALGYLLLVLVFWRLQNSFVFPGAGTQGHPDAVINPGQSYELLSLKTADGTKITALFGKALDAKLQPLPRDSNASTVLFFYGNGSCMAYCVDIFNLLRSMGYNVIVPDYEGYGMSDGQPSEAGCYTTADAAYDYLLSRSDIDHRKFIALGWSLGGAVAIDLASRRPVTHLATAAAFTTLTEMARRLMPGLPISLILKYRFDNVGKLPTITCPILLIHGTRDSLVPFGMMPKLAAVARSKVTVVPIKDRDHNDILDPDDPRPWTALTTFFGQ
jgi:uncharacterized protein